MSESADLDVLGVNGPIVFTLVDELVFGIGAKVCDLDLEIKTVIILLVLPDTCGEIRSRDARKVSCYFYQVKYLGYGEYLVSSTYGAGIARSTLTGLELRST